MITTVFDTNNMFFRSLYQVGGFGKDAYTFDKQFELDQLMRKIATDTAYTIRQLTPSRVIFAVDNGSWRKDIEIEENEGYKGHREKTEHINWDNVYATMAEFLTIMESQGFLVTKIYKAEADDLMALWADKILFEKNEHVILVSGDEDIRQLAKDSIDNDGNQHFTTVFNPFTYKKGDNKKMFVTAGFNKWLKDEDEVNDIFNTSSDTDKSSFMKTFAGNVDVIEIDGEDIALRKIFCGDDGDNVPAFYTWMGTTSKGEPKQYRITAGKYTKIKATLNLTDYVDLMGQEDKLEEELKLIAKHDLPIDVGNRLKRQIKLVVLNKHEFPENIVEEFKKTSDENLDEPQHKVKGATLLTLLEGTRYITESNKSYAPESSIFKEMDQISKNLFT